MPTLVAVLRILEPKGRENSVMNRIKEGDSQITTEVDNLLQTVGRHGRGAKGSETLFSKPCRAVSYLRFERSRRTGEYTASLTLSGNRLT
jgi:hypothetical protein